MTTMMLEMDRILRPGGRVYIRDTINVMSEIQEIGNAMRWHTSLCKTAEGPHSSYRILLCERSGLNRLRSVVPRRRGRIKGKKLDIYIECK
ncbi:unnamed protein product [Arabidopsis halleri]